MISQTEPIKSDASSLECEEQMYLGDWKQQYTGDDDSIDSGRSSVSTVSSLPDNAALNVPMFSAVFDSYTDISAQYPYFVSAPESDDWKDKHPCLWNQNDVITWLFHLNQHPKLPTRVTNKDLEVSAFASLSGPDLVQMSCNEYLRCDPANAMFIYLALQEEMNKHQTVKSMELSAPAIEQESPLNASHKPSDSQFKLNSVDLRMLSFDKNEMFSSIRSLKNEPETSISQPAVPLTVPPAHMSPAYSTGTPSPSTPPYSPPLNAANSPPYTPTSPPMMCAPHVPSEHMMHEQRYYQFYPQAVPFVSSSLAGFNISEIKGNHLWEFVRDLLLDSRYNPSIIRWEDREKGIFRFVRSDKVAKLWGLRKNNPAMTYEKLSRAMRYYYQRKILERIDGKRLVYKFGPMATGWKP